ncbi:tetratricopeptide repeat protein [bacterium]|nr:tetratricopeptide repeat protein [bacterium]MBU1957317.1 tetratricopeptide repeat protein [bacterium]
MWKNKKNTYESTDVIYHGGMKYGADIHGVTLKVNKIIWDMIKILEEKELYGFHFTAKIGVNKSIVIIRHKDIEMLDKAKQLLKEFQEIQNLLILMKPHQEQGESRAKFRIGMLFIILLLTAVGTSLFYYYNHMKNVPIEKKIKLSTNEDPIIEKVEIDIKTLKALQESFENENTPEQAMVMQAMEISTAVISDMVPDSMKEEYSSEALVQNFKGKSGIQFVLKDTNMSEDLNLSIKELHRYATKFIDDNNVSNALKCYDKILESHTSQLKEEEMLNVLADMGDAYVQMDELVKADEAYSKSLEINQKLAKKDFEHYAAAAALTMTKLVHIEEDLNQTDASTNFFLAIDHLNDVEKIYKDLVVVYRKLARKNPKFHEQNLAWSLNTLANFYNDEKGDFNQSIEVRKEALELYTKLSKKKPKVFNLKLFQTLNSLAKSYMSIYKLKLALKAYEKALLLIEGMVKENEAQYRQYLALSLNSLGTLHTKKESFKEAQKYYEKALVVYQELVKKEPEIYRPYMVFIQHDVASLYSHKKEFSVAKKKYNEVIGEYEKLNLLLPYKYNAKMAQALQSSAWIDIVQGNNLIEAKRNLNEAIKLGRSIETENRKSSKAIVAVSYAYLAHVSILEKRIESALSYYQQSLDLVQNFKVAKAHARLLGERKMYIKARAAFESMLKTYHQKEEQAETWMLYGMFYLDIDSNGAKNKLKRSLELYTELDKENVKIYPELNEIKLLLESNITAETN